MLNQSSLLLLRMDRFLSFGARALVLARTAVTAAHRDARFGADVDRFAADHQLSAVAAVLGHVTVAPRCIDGTFEHEMARLERHLSAREAALLDAADGHRARAVVAQDQARASSDHHFLG